jgi:TetR/AcrR family transcriptional regulator
MTENGTKHGRVHNAEGARKAILNASEVEFAEHGFAGARVDEIAAQAGYNKGWLFRYFGDKLKLYAEVLKRADRETNQLRAQVLAPLFLDESLATDPHRFKAFLANMIRANFDYLVDHPRVLRILMWEMADSWKTYAKISAEFSQEELAPFYQACRKAVEAGLLHSDFLPVIQLTITQPVCQVYLAYLPIYQISFPGQDFTSPEALVNGREFIVDMILSGIYRDQAGYITQHRGTDAN